MYCPYCGVANNDSSLFCYACGTEIPSSEKCAAKKAFNQKLLSFVVGAGAACLFFAFVLFLSAHWPQRVDSPAATPQENITSDIDEEDMLSLNAMRDILTDNAPDGAKNYTVGLDAVGRLFLVSFSVDTSDWAKTKQLGVDFCSNELSAIRAFCGENIHLMVQVSDDFAPDNALLTVTDGVVVYDAFVGTDK